MKLKRMKFNNMFYLVFLLSLTISASCSKDEEDEQEFSIIGTWNIDKVAVWWEDNTTGELIEGPDGGLNTGTIVFNEDKTGTWTDTQEGEVSSITWELYNNQLTIAMEDDPGIQWTIAEKSNESLSLTYQKLTGNTLEKREIDLSKLN